MIDAQQFAAARPLHRKGASTAPSSASDLGEAPAGHGSIAGCQQLLRFLEATLQGVVAARREWTPGRQLAPLEQTSKRLAPRGRSIVDAWDGCDEAARIRMKGRQEKLVRAADLDHAAGIHDADPVRD